jgi:hypothetical protein
MRFLAAVIQVVAVPGILLAALIHSALIARRCASGTTG